VKVTFITTTFNAQDFISATIKSVLDLQLKDFEYIIQDAVSTDDTIKICSAFKNVNTYIEKDSGIYDGMNKAISRAKGDIVVILNAGDTLDKAGFTEILDIFELQTDVDIIAASVNMLNRSSGRTHCWQRSKSKLSNANATVKHPAIFVRKHVYDNVGTFDLNYPISADYEFVCRCLEYGLKIHETNTITTIVDDEGFSTSLKNHYAKNKEHYRIQSKSLKGLSLLINKGRITKKLFIGFVYLIKKKL
jgi:glycosyltransferase involved in cell wall biosynthesis